MGCFGSWQTLPATAVDLPAGVDRVLQGGAVTVLRHIVDVPALRVAVEVVLVDVAVHAVAERLAVGDGVAHAFLAAEAVVGGEEVREGAVVPAFLEADHAHLRLVDADFLEAAHDVLEVLEGVLHQDGRHGLQPVLPRGLRAVAASELAPHEEGLRRVREGLVALDALAERLHFASVELPFAVEAPHAGVRGVGAVQLVRRRSLLRVDPDVILLGLYYILVILAYLAFEMIPINYRPILINGVLEASYPSSTTLLVLSVMPTLKFQLDRRTEKPLIRKMTNIFTIMFSSFMVIGRLIAGVHWATDIIGAVFLSMGLFLLYRYAVDEADRRREDRNGIQ